MAEQSLQERQRRRQKAVKEPVCASRVIKNLLYGTGWSGKLSSEERNMATSLLDDAGAMYSLQVNRDREADALSLHNAIFWEHRQLSDQTIVSTPGLVWEQQQQLNDQNITTGVVHAVPFFSSSTSAWHDSLKEISKQASASSSSTVEIHHFFSNIRDREFTVWPVLVDRIWITIIMRVEAMETTEFEQGTSSNYYFDRRVTRLAIVDTINEERDDRRAVILKRLKNLLRHGCIRLDDWATLPALRCDQVESDWETGYMAYAISREFLRRLKVVTYNRLRSMAMGEANGNLEKSFLWGPFEETPRIDGYRESLMAACSNYVIAISGYRIRNALEVPSSAAGHHAEKLWPVEPPGTRTAADEKINIGDQTRRFELKINLPEGISRESSVEAQPEMAMGVESQAVESGSDTESEHESESGYSDIENAILECSPEPEVQISEPKPTSPADNQEAPPEDDQIMEEPGELVKDPSSSGTITADISEPSPPSTEVDNGLKGSAQEKRLMSVASAAQDLTEEIQASMQPREEIAVQSDTTPDDIPPTQQPVDEEDDHATPAAAEGAPESDEPAVNITSDDKAEDPEKTTDGVESESPPVVATVVAAATAATVEDGVEDGEPNRKETDSIFGAGGDSPSADSDTFIPEDDAEDFVVEEKNAEVDPDPDAKPDTKPDANLETNPETNPESNAAGNIADEPKVEEQPTNEDSIVQDAPEVSPSPRPARPRSPFDSSDGPSIIPGLSATAAVVPSSSPRKRHRDEDDYDDDDDDDNQETSPSPKRHKGPTTPPPDGTPISN